jgi:hypothetical protein
MRVASIDAGHRGQLCREPLTVAVGSGQTVTVIAAGSEAQPPTRAVTCRVPEAAAPPGGRAGLHAARGRAGAHRGLRDAVGPRDAPGRPAPWSCGASEASTGRAARALRCERRGRGRRLCRRPQCRSGARRRGCLERAALARLGRPLARCPRPPCGRSPLTLEILARFGQARGLKAGQVWAQMSSAHGSKCLVMSMLAQICAGLLRGTTGLKIFRPKGHAGSNPASGINKISSLRQEALSSQADRDPEAGEAADQARPGALREAAAAVRSQVWAPWFQQLARQVAPTLPDVLCTWDRRANPIHTSLKTHDARLPCPCEPPAGSHAALLTLLAVSGSHPVRSLLDRIPASGHDNHMVASGSPRFAVRCQQFAAAPIAQPAAAVREEGLPALRGL